MIIGDLYLILICTTNEFRIDSSAHSATIHIQLYLLYFAYFAEQIRFIVFLTLK